MALTVEVLDRLHRRIDELAAENPACVEALARFLEAAITDDDNGERQEVASRRRRSMASDTRPLRSTVSQARQASSDRCATLTSVC